MPQVKELGSTAKMPISAASTAPSDVLSLSPGLDGLNSENTPAGIPAVIPCGHLSNGCAPAVFLPRSSGRFGIHASGSTPSGILGTGNASTGILGTCSVLSDIHASCGTPTGIFGTGNTPSGIHAGGSVPFGIHASGSAPSDIQAGGRALSDILRTDSAPSDIHASSSGPSGIHAGGGTPFGILGTGSTPSGILSIGPRAALSHGWAAVLLAPSLAWKTALDQTCMRRNQVYIYRVNPNSNPNLS